MGRARDVAREIAANAPLAVQAAKRMMRMGLNETFPDHVHHVYLQLLPLFKNTGHAGRHQGVHGKARAEIHGALMRACRLTMHAALAIICLAGW